MPVFHCSVVTAQLATGILQQQLYKLQNALFNLKFNFKMKYMLFTMSRNPANSTAHITILVGHNKEGITQ